MTQRYGMTVPFSGVPLGEQRDVGWKIGLRDKKVVASSISDAISTPPNTTGVKRWKTYLCRISRRGEKSWPCCKLMNYAC